MDNRIFIESDQIDFHRLLKLRKIIRNEASKDEIEDAILKAIDRKPKGHDFEISRRKITPAVQRHMSVTGG